MKKRKQYARSVVVSLSQNKVDLKLGWCSHKAAKYAVEHWHYSRCMPMPPLLKIGVWENSKFIGVILFSRGASPALGNAYNLKNIELCELTRIALKKHITHVSRMIAISIKMLKAKEKNIRLIVSFADINVGHHGGIYQASGWLYYGRSKEKFDYIGPDGKKYLSRQVANSGYVKQFGKFTKCYTRKECIEVPVLGKHRYLYPLDKEMRKQIELLRKPYPKRPLNREVNGSTVDRQCEPDPDAPFSEKK